MSQLLRARRVLTERGWLEDHQLRIESGIITAIEPIPVGITSRDAELLCPAYIDTHVHGGAGVDVMDDAPDVLILWRYIKRVKAWAHFCPPPSPRRWRPYTAHLCVSPGALAPAGPARRFWVAISKVRTLRRKTKGRTRRSFSGSWISLS